MTNRRARRPAQPRDFSPRGALSEGNVPITRLDSNADEVRAVAPGNLPTGERALRAKADAEAALASALAPSAAKLSAWADRAAAEDGARAGAAAGNDPDYRPTGASTIRGRAFEQAATQTYLDNLDARMREDINKIAQAHTGNPVGMVDAFAKMKKVYEDRDLFPEIAGRFDAAFKRATLAPVRTAQRAVDARARSERHAALDNTVATRLRDLERNAYALGLDAEADETLAADLLELRGVLDGTDPHGTPLLSAQEQERLMRDATRTVARARVSASFDRLESVDAKKKFLDQFEEDYKAGAETIEALDLRAFEQIKTHMETAIKRQSGGARAAINDDIASIRATGQGTALNRTEVQAAFGPDGLQTWLDQRQDAATYHATTADMAGLPADVIEARLAALAPQPGQEGFARQAKLHDEAAKEADRILTLRARDPAAAVLAVPSVKAAYDAATDGEPEKVQAAVTASLAAQEAAGVPAYARRPVTVAEARELAAPLVAEAWRTGRDDVSAEEKAAIEDVLATVTERYGPFAEDVLPYIVEETTKDRQMGPVFAALFHKMNEGAPPSPADLGRAEAVTDAAAAETSIGSRIDLPRLGSLGTLDQPEKVWPQPPPRAMRALRDSPERAAEFDAKYGPGAANRILRGGDAE